MHLSSVILLAFLITFLPTGCAHRSAEPEVVLEPPWKDYAAKIADLVDQKPHRSTLESKLGNPKTLIKSQLMLTEMLSSYNFSEAEKKTHKEWFKDSTSVLLYNFEFQFSGVLFFDAKGNLKHAILLG